MKTWYDHGRAVKDQYFSRGKERNAGNKHEFFRLGVEVGVRRVLSMKAACPEWEVKISMNLKESCVSYCAYSLSKGHRCRNVSLILQLLSFLHISVRTFSTQNMDRREKHTNKSVCLSRIYTSSVLRSFNLLFMK